MKIVDFAKKHQKILITIGIAVTIVYAYKSYFGGKNVNPATVNLANANDNAYKS